MARMSAKPKQDTHFFPTCQVRVVRFYVSLPVLLLLFLLLLARSQPRSCESSVACRTSTTIMWEQCCVPDLNCDPVRAVLRAGPQPRSCEISVACRTSTAILWVQCCVPDLNRDRVSSVLRAGPQLRAREFSVACRTSTAILWGQCCAPDLNCDPVSSVLRVGPQPRSCEISVSDISLISENVSGGPLPCFGMFIWACFGMFVSAMVLSCLLEHVWQVLYWVEDRTRQNHAKM